MIVYFGEPLRFGLKVLLKPPNSGETGKRR